MKAHVFERAQNLSNMISGHRINNEPLKDPYLIDC